MNTLEKKLLERPLDDQILINIQKIKTKLEIILIEETRGAMIRAGIKWSELGGKIINIFLISKSREAMLILFLE